MSAGGFLIERASPTHRADLPGACRGVDQQTEDVLRLRGGAHVTAPLAPAMAAAVAAETEAGEAAERAQAAAGTARAASGGGSASRTEPTAQRVEQTGQTQSEPATHDQPASSSAGAALEVYMSPHMRQAAQAEQASLGVVAQRRGATWGCPPRTHVP